MASRDFFAWTQEQAAALADHNVSSLDWNGLMEEVENMGKSDRRELKSFLEVLLEHLLKLEFHRIPANVMGWERSVRYSRRRIQDIIADSPSLSRYAEEVLGDAYQAARVDVEKEYGSVPGVCLWTIDHVLYDQGGEASQRAEMEC